MDIFYCPDCEGKPYTDNIKSGSKCPKCGAVLKYEDVSQQALNNREKLEYPTKKVQKSKSTKGYEISFSKKYRKLRTVSGMVENLKPCKNEQREFFTKLLHYIIYHQSWSDTLYSFDITPRNEDLDNQKIHVHIYGDYCGDGATICSGFDHTVKGRMAVKNLSENDNNIFFAYHVRNNDSEIRFSRSPAGFMMTAFVIYFIYSLVMALKEPMMSGTMLDEIRKVFSDFVPSAKAVASMFAIVFVISSIFISVNKNKTHIIFNFNSVFIFSLMVTMLFFIRYNLVQFADLSLSESFSTIIAFIVTSLLPVFASCMGVFLLLKLLSLITRIRR